MGQMSDTTVTGVRSAPQAAYETPPLPSIAVVVAGEADRDPLERCLTALAATGYSGGTVEFLVVDARDGDGEHELAERFPTVTFLRRATTVGVATAATVAAESTSAECLVFVGSTIQVQPGWLEALVAQYRPADDVVCVGGIVLESDGETVRFADPAITTRGVGVEPRRGRSKQNVALEPGRILPWASRQLMLVRRDVYRGLEGFDPAYHGVQDDVDFGWRLMVSGYGTVQAPDAVGHAVEPEADPRRDFEAELLQRRGGYRSLLKNVGEEHLGLLLGATSLLHSSSVYRDLEGTRNAFNHRLPTRMSLSVERRTLSVLKAQADVVQELPQIMEERRKVQTRRRTDDAVIFERMRRPLLTEDAVPVEEMTNKDEAYLERALTVDRAMGLDRVFDKRQATSVAIVAYDRIGEKMAGPGVRCWEIAKAMSRFADVTLLSPEPIGREHPGVSVELFDGKDELRRYAEQHDVLIVQGQAVRHYPLLRHTQALLVVDLYDPWSFADLEHTKSRSPRDATWGIRYGVDVLVELVNCGDFFICGSERQRDYWLGMLTSRGRLDRAVYGADETLRDLIDVVPYGCPAEPPVASPVLKGVHPDVPDDAIVYMWSGGAWDWFDPLLVVDAFADVAEREPRARLFFMGLQLEGRAVSEMGAARAIKARVSELGLDGKVVYGGWVPYDERGAYLLEADAAISATRDIAEVRLAFRSRVLDHFWAGLPTITTGGDVLADAICEHGAGLVVAPGDRDSMVQAMLRVAHDDEFRETMQDAARDLASRHTWQQSVRPLQRMVENPYKWRAVRAARPVAAHMTEDVAMLVDRWRGLAKRGVRWRLRRWLRQSSAAAPVRWLKSRARP